MWMGGKDCYSSWGPHTHFYQNWFCTNHSTSSLQARLQMWVYCHNYVSREIEYEILNGEITSTKGTCVFHSFSSDSFSTTIVLIEILLSAIKYKFKCDSKRRSYSVAILWGFGIFLYLDFPGSKEKTTSDLLSSNY